MKKYKCDLEYPALGVTQVYVERETNCFVVIDGKRFPKYGDVVKYCDTFNDAKSALIAYATNKLEILAERTKIWKNRLERINDLKEVV